MRLSSTLKPGAGGGLQKPQLVSVGGCCLFPTKYFANTKIPTNGIRGSAKKELKRLSFRPAAYTIVKLTIGYMSMWASFLQPCECTLYVFGSFAILFVLGRFWFGSVVLSLCLLLVFVVACVWLPAVVGVGWCLFPGLLWPIVLACARVQLCMSVCVCVCL